MCFGVLVVFKGVELVVVWVVVVVWGGGRMSSSGISRCMGSSGCMGWCSNEQRWN